MSAGGIAISILVVASAVSGVLFLDANTERRCLDLDQVVDVGSCNRHGRCQAKMESGRFKEVYLPAKGLSVCFVHELVWKEAKP